MYRGYSESGFRMVGSGLIFYRVESGFFVGRMCIFLVGRMFIFFVGRMRIFLVGRVLIRVFWMVGSGSGFLPE